MAVDINIQSQIVVKTAAQWAADATVYSGQRLLVTSDATYTGTDQRKFKIANGVDTWSNLDYFPVNTGTVDGTGSANTLPYWVDADTLSFLSTATYPDLTELSYVKGVTSAIQTQLNGKEPSITTLSIAKGGTNSGTALTNDKVMISSAGAIVEANTATYPSVTELSYVKGVTSAIQTQLNGKQATLTNPVTGTGVTNEIAYFTGTSTIGSLATATYPSLTEVSYVKGVTSAIQTQLNNKQALDSDLTAIAALSPSNDDIIQRKAGAWTNRTMAQLAADLTASNITGYQGYVIQGGLGSSSPADATTYYFGRTLGAVLTTSDGALDIYIPEAGTIKTISLQVRAGGTVGSNETSSAWLRLNSTTDTLISNAIRTDVNANYGGAGFNIAVAQGDSIGIKWTTPTWATNPVGVVINVVIYFE